MYKTAKPLLHAVYRTRNRKQEGKEICFEVVPKTVSVGAEVTSDTYNVVQKARPAHIFAFIFETRN